jgi:transposase
VPGISAITAQTILCEIGTDVSRFRNASAFAFWLGLCPENKISGGEVLYTKSRRVRSRVATALRMAANSLLSTKEAYNETVFHRCDEEVLRRAQFRLRRQAAQLGFQVIPLQNG